MCCGFNPSSCPSYFLFAPTHYKGCWKQPGGQVLWTRRRDLGSRGARIRSVSPSSTSTGWPLFRRSSLKRSFRSRSWMTASFVPWISSSEAILAVLLAFFGNPLHSESRRGTVSTSPSQTGSITKAQRSKMLFTIYLFKAHAVVHMKRTTEDAFRSSGSTNWNQFLEKVQIPKRHLQWRGKCHGWDARVSILGGKNVKWKGDVACYQV